MPVRPRTAGLCEQHRLPTDREAGAVLLRVRWFAEGVVRPLGLALDRQPLAETVASGSPLYEFLDQVGDEGFGVGLAEPEAEYAVLEEIAAADAGLGALVMTARIGGPRSAIACLHSPARPGRFRLDRDGLVWRLSGSARAPVIGAGAATHFAVVCSAGSGSAPRQALVVVPVEREGVRRAAVESQLGLRAGAAAMLACDGVAVRRDELLEHGERGCPRIAHTLALDHVTVALLSVGIARSAYEGASRWAFERGGEVPRRLPVMRAMLERARTVARAAHAQLRSARPAAVGHAPFARMLASQTAAELARQALWIVGPSALDPGGVEYLDGSRFHPEKLVRDAHEHGFMLARRPATPRRRSVHLREQRSASWGL